MTRAQLEHPIRAAATIADDKEIVVIGSQAVLGQFPHPLCSNDWIRCPSTPKSATRFAH